MGGFTYSTNHSPVLFLMQVAVAVIIRYLGQIL